MARISRIVIDQQLAQIGVKVTPAKMNIELPRPEMRITQEKPKMTIDQQVPTFEYDRQKVMDESGLKNPDLFSREYANEGKYTALAATAKTAQEGDYLAKVQNPGNRVVQIARQNNLQRSKKDINIGLMPKSSPEIEWSPGSMNINWSGHNLKIEWEGDYLPEMAIDPRYSVEVFLRTKPHFRVSLEEDVSLYDTGRNIDKML